MEFSEYGGADVFFHLPFWFARCGRSNYDSGGRINTAEAALWRLSGVKETCLDHQCWVKVEFTCAPAKLPAQIIAWQAKLDRFLIRWHKTLK